MSNLFDDVARIVASPISRRQAIRLVSGAVLTGWGLGRAAWALGAQTASTTCPSGQTPCGTTCCKTGQTCCEPLAAKCCGPGKVCCPGPTAGKVQCCLGGPTPGNPCQGATNCSNATPSHRKTVALVGGAAGGAAATALALTSGAPTSACPSGQTVCGTICCTGNQTCCEPLGAKCCSPGKVCCAGPTAGRVQCCAVGPSPSSPCVGATKCS